MTAPCRIQKVTRVQLIYGPAAQASCSLRSYGGILETCTGDVLRVLCDVRSEFECRYYCGGQRLSAPLCPGIALRNGRVARHNHM